MKVEESKVDDKRFQPFGITITVYTEKEAETLKLLFSNVSVNGLIKAVDDRNEAIAKRLNPNTLSSFIDGMYRLLINKI